MSTPAPDETDPAVGAPGTSLGHRMPVLISPVHVIRDGDTLAATPPLLGVIAATRIVENEHATDDWLVLAFDSALKLRARHHRTGAGTRVDWLDLLSTLREPAVEDADAKTRSTADQPTMNPIALARIVNTAQALLDKQCAIGRPLRYLQRITGDRYSIARQAIRDRKLITCDGAVCGGYAHGPVLLPDDFADALAAVLEDRR